MFFECFLNFSWTVVASHCCVRVSRAAGAQLCVHSAPLSLDPFLFRATGPPNTGPDPDGRSSPVTCFMLVFSQQSCPTLCNPMDCSPPHPSVGFSRREDGSGLPFPPPGAPPHPGIEPWSPALQADSSLLAHQESPVTCFIHSMCVSIPVPPVPHPSSTSLFSAPVSLFPLCRYGHLYHFSGFLSYSVFGIALCHCF